MKKYGSMDVLYCGGAGMLPNSTCTNCSVWLTFQTHKFLRSLVQSMSGKISNAIPDQHAFSNSSGFEFDTSLPTVSFHWHNSLFAKEVFVNRSISLLMVCGFIRF